MPSASLLMPWFKILSLALSNEPVTSPSIGPSRISRSSDMASARWLRVLRRLRLAGVIMLLKGLAIAASLLARPRWGERFEALTFRRTGDPERWSGWC